MSRLASMDRASGVVVRYQRTHPGELIHIDVKKWGGSQTVAAPRPRPPCQHPTGRGIGYDYVHSAVDDRSRVAFSQILPDETAMTAAYS